MSHQVVHVAAVVKYAFVSLHHLAGCVVSVANIVYLLYGRCRSCYRILLQVHVQIKVLAVYILILVGTFGYILCLLCGRFLRYYHLRKIRNTDSIPGIGVDPRAVNTKQ